MYLYRLTTICFKIWFDAITLTITLKYISTISMLVTRCFTPFIIMMCRKRILALMSEVILANLRVNDRNFTYLLIVNTISLQLWDKHGPACAMIDIWVCYAIAPKFRLLFCWKLGRRNSWLHFIIFLFLLLIIFLCTKLLLT